ncbi:unnamed protein product [Calypogeia fissa]
MQQQQKKHEEGVEWRWGDGWAAMLVLWGSNQGALTYRKQEDFDKGKRKAEWKPESGRGIEHPLPKSRVLCDCSCAHHIRFRPIVSKGDNVTAVGRHRGRLLHSFVLEEERKDQKWFSRP